MLWRNLRASITAGISVNDLAGLIMEIVRNRVDCVHEEPRAGGVRDSLGISLGIRGIWVRAAVRDGGWA